MAARAGGPRYVFSRWRNDSTLNGSLQFDSMAVTLEILQHYCQLDHKYVDDAVLMNRRTNAISVIPHFQKRFECLTLGLKPTPVRRGFFLPPGRCSC